MSTAKGHSDIPSTAVEFAPGLWRTNLQRYGLSVPGREVIQSRVDIEPDSPPIRHTHPGEEIIYVLPGTCAALATDVVEKGKPLLTLAQ
jgi:quercetin dioxygenase-like cupin family protein